VLHAGAHVVVASWVAVHVPLFPLVGIKVAEQSQTFVLEVHTPAKVSVVNARLEFGQVTTTGVVAEKVAAHTAVHVAAAADVLEKPRVVQPPTVPAGGKTALVTPAARSDAVIVQRLAVKPHVPGLPAVMLQVPVGVVEVAKAAEAVHVSEPTEVAVYVAAQPGMHTPAA